MESNLNKKSLDTLCAALAYATGVEAPEKSAAPSPELCAYVDEQFGGKKADRLFMYNPDAIAQWIYEKYPQLCKEATALTDIKLPFQTTAPPKRHLGPSLEKDGKTREKGRQRLGQARRLRPQVVLIRGRPQPRRGPRAAQPRRPQSPSQNKSPSCECGGAYSRRPRAGAQKIKVDDLF